jgi:hypothetical protein
MYYFSILPYHLQETCLFAVDHGEDESGPEESLVLAAGQSVESNLLGTCRHACMMQVMALKSHRSR